MPNKKRITISGYYGFANAGDEAVLSAIVSSMQKEAGDMVEITALSASPEETEATHGIRAVPRMALSQVSDAIRSCDLFISGGGSLIQDATSLRSLIYYLTLIGLAKFYRRKVMILGQGIGPLRRGFARRLSALVLNGVDMITVRDAQSAELLREIGVKKPTVQVTADPTLLLTPCSDDEVNRLLSDVGISGDEEIVAVSLRRWPEAPELEAAEKTAFEQIAKELPARLLFITMQTPFDRQLSEEMAGSIQTAAVQPEAWSAEQLIGVLGKCSMVVGMRLHALILAATVGVPSIGISYDPKVEHFIDISGQEGITLSDTARGLLADRVKQAWNRRTELASRLSDRIPAMRASAMENIRLALKMLDL
ncbi:MAG: polysaccharide pyruvyl transferase CsaB [Armatimonadota bacterium]